MLSEIDDLRTAAQMAAKLDFAGTPGQVAAEAVLELEAIRSMVDAAEANALSAVDASKEWMIPGHKSPAAWLKYEGRLPKDRARKATKMARDLRAMPATADALASGSIHTDRARLLAKANRSVVAEAFARDEAALVAVARRQQWWEFVKELQYWEAANDPDQLEKDALSDEESREFHCSATIGGMRRMDGWLDPVNGTVFDTELRRREQELFEADWAEARERLGDDATADDLRRTPKQRRADALVEMAKRSATLQGKARAPLWVLNLHMNWATYCAETARYEGTAPAEAPYPDEMLCELDDGTVIPPSQLLSLALQGQVRRVVFGPDGHILEFGRAKRFFDGGLREALNVRDRTCAHPSCEAPARMCQADHIRPWVQGGTTGETNGRIYCGFHNRWDYRTRWQC